MMDHPACFQLDELGRYTSEFSTLLHHNSKETPAHASSSPPRLQDPARSTHLTALNNGSFPSHPPHFPQQQQQQGEPARELLVEGTVEDLGPILAGLTELSKRTKANAQAKLGLLSPHPPGSAGRHSADVERLQGFKNQLHHLQDSLLKSAQSKILHDDLPCPPALLTSTLLTVAYIYLSLFVRE